MYHRETVDMTWLIPTLTDLQASTWVGVILILSALYYVANAVTDYWRLRHFKGPAWAAWSQWWWIRTIMSTRAHLILADVNTRYGPVARIGPNTLLTCDEELYRKMNTARSGYYRPDFYKAFRFDADNENLLSDCDNERHAAMRRRFSPGFTDKENVRMEPDMDRVIWDVIESWRTRFATGSASTTPVMDLARQIQYMTLDIITSISLGESFGYVTSNSDVHEYISTMHKNFPAMTFMSAVPSLARLIRQPWFVRHFGPSTKDRVGLGRIKAVTSDIIAGRFAPDRKAIDEDDMTETFIRAGATRAEIEDNVLLQILAGSDTSAAVIRSGFLYMISNPRVMRRLQAEADRSGVPLDEIIDSTRVVELPYLSACVKEALRCHPGATGLLPRVVPPQGETVTMPDGSIQFIPGGTVLALSAWSLHSLNFDAYGPDANIFRPERWIEATAAAAKGNPERLYRMEKAHDLVFGYGDWRCLGFRIAQLEIRKAFFELNRRFDFGIVNPKQPFESDINYGLFLQQGMWVTVHERNRGE